MHIFFLKAELEESWLPCQVWNWASGGLAEEFSSKRHLGRGPLTAAESHDPVRQPVVMGTDHHQFVPATS